MNVDLKEKKRKKEKKNGGLPEHVGEFNFSFHLSRHSCVLQNSMIFFFYFVHLHTFEVKVTKLKYECSTTHTHTHACPVLSSLCAVIISEKLHGILF
jgi:hypothetical protein